MKKIGFIGCGNMGGALVRAAAKSVDPKQIYIANRTPAKSEALAAETGVQISDASSIAVDCDYIFLGIKPQGIAELLTSLRPVLDARTDRVILVTMLAGTTIARIRELAGNLPVIRIMPNLPVAVGAGTVLYCAEGVTDAELSLFTSLLSHAGLFCPLRETLIDAGSAVAGCSPAFTAMFIEAMADGGVQCGLPRKDALLYAEQAVLGTAKLLLETGTHPDELKDAVCSPGGTTIAGVAALEKGAFRAASADAVISAYQKTLKLKG